ncbi:hypothetical protein [Mycolicibacterium sp. 120270]|uniref:hypothetical protein n=1 Tax=Mycolicibacterium sp. 120270 TaxID=3090600 RepID=UPI0039AF329D
MKNPAKKTTATMKTTPATMPTQTKIEFGLWRTSSYGGVVTACRSAADSRMSLMAESSLAPKQAG